jgi:hypothetical protein
MTERERTMTRLSLGRSPTKMATQLIHPADDDESGNMVLVKYQSYVYLQIAMNRCCLDQAMLIVNVRQI